MRNSNSAADHPSKARLCLAVFATALLASQNILAGGLYLTQIATPGSVGTAGVANVVNRFTPDSAFTNPAGMTGIQQDSFMAGMQLAIPVVEFDSSIATAASVSLPRERFWDIQVAKIDSQTRQPLCPGRPASMPLRHTIASSALATQHSLKWLDGVSDVIPDPLWRSARRVSRITYAYWGLPALAFRSPWLAANEQ